MAITFNCVPNVDGTLRTSHPNGDYGGSGGGWNYLSIPDPTVFHALANPQPWPFDPRFHPDPGRPAAWDTGTEEPGYYYVDFGNTTGNATDTNNTWGTPQQPRLTIPQTHTNDGSAGSTIRIELTGSQTGNTQRFTLQGSDFDNLVWLVGDPNAPVQFNDREGEFLDCRYCMVDGIQKVGPLPPAGTLTTRGGFGLRADTEDFHHTCFRNITIRDIGYSTGGKSGFSTSVSDPYKALGGHFRFNVFYNFTISNLGANYDWSTADYDFHGVSLSSFNSDNTTGWSSSYNWLLEINGQAISGNTIQVTGQGSTAGSERDTLHHIYIAKPVGIDNRQPSVGIKTSDHVIISEWECSGTRSYAGGQGDAIGTQYNPDNLWIVHGEGYNCNHGVRSTNQSTFGPDEPGNIYIYGNLFYDIQNFSNANLTWNDYYGGSAIYFQRGNVDPGEPSNIDRYIWNNSFYNCTRCVSARGEDGTTGYEHSVETWGNAYHVNETTGGSFNIPAHLAFNDEIGVRSSSDRNVFVDDEGGLAFTGRADFTNYTDITAWRNTQVVTNELRDQNSVIGSMAWQNATTDRVTRNFEPGASMAGQSLSTFVTKDGIDLGALFQQQYGTTLKVDRNGNPTGDTPDVGCYQRVA